MSPNTFTTLGLAADHINEAAASTNPVARFESLFKGLDVFTGTSETSQRGAKPAILRAIRNHVTPKKQKELIDSVEVKTLSTLQPRIMNHFKLRQHKFRYPNIPETVREETSYEHTRFTQLISSRFIDYPTALDALISLLYMVRSNNAHGEKTPNGPDLDKRDRDYSVCEVTAPVVDKILRLLLDHPERRLLTYGTLSPGGANFNMLASITTYPRSVQIKGKIISRNGLNYFDRYYRSADPMISCVMLESDDLPQIWPRLDDFEGKEYQRILLPYLTDENEAGVGYIYAGANLT
jgi:gamma-glutamylcyclotransferase (GGCT)/AIG2-like uncharacterized protein YtfP